MSFYDLNFPFDNDAGSQNHREKLAMAVKLGYHVVALNHQVTASSALSSQYPPPPGFVAAAGDFLGSVCGAAVSAACKQRVAATLPSSTVVQLQRLTVLLEDPAMSPHLNAAQSALAAWDLVAVQPTSDRTFHQACSSLQVDVVVLDLAKRLPFRLRPNLIKEAIARGLTFEISYSGLVRGGVGRRQLIGQAVGLVRSVGQKGGVILSSGALRAAELRGPHDVINLGGLLGLNLHASQVAVSEGCRRALQHAEARRTFKGVFNLKPALEDDQEVRELDMQEA